MLKVLLKASFEYEHDINTLIFSASASEVSKWKRMETILAADASSSSSSLHLTTTKKGVIWLDQVSAMPVDTYKVCFPSSSYFIIKFLT